MRREKIITHSNITKQSDDKFYSINEPPNPLSENSTNNFTWDVSIISSSSYPTTNSSWVTKTEDSTNKVIKTNVFDVAAYIIKKLGRISTVKLQKLVYYCQAWSLVWDDKVIFTEPIEAWANGPVVKELYILHRGWYDIDNVIIGNSDKLDVNQKDTVDKVLEYYGAKSPGWLVDLTHLEKPWVLARKGLDPLERGNKEISLESMIEYYTAL